MMGPQIATHLLTIGGLTGASGLATAMLLFRDLIKDTWSAALSKWREPKYSRPYPPPPAAASAAPISQAPRSDALSLELVHELLEIFRRQMEQTGAANNQQFAIMRETLADLKNLVQVVAGIKQQQDFDSKMIAALFQQRSA